MARKALRVPSPRKQGSRKTVTIIGIVAAVVLVIAGVLLYLTVGRKWLTPKQTVVFQPDPALIGSDTISSDTLNETARLLGQRWSFLGYGNPLASFSVLDTSQIVGKIPASVELSFIDQVKVPGVLEFVDFGKKSMSPGTIVNTDYVYGYQAASTDTKWHTIMTGGAIHTVSAYASPNGGYEVLFGLTDTGKKILSDYSTQNTGNYLGIVMDKVVISCPQIAAPVTDGAGVINGNFTRQAAEIFVALIRSGPLPIPLK